MQKVSKKYKESMKSPLRERAYMMVSFGLINQEAQAKSTISDGDFTYFSDKKLFDDKKEIYRYGTMEENVTRVNDSMYFLPRKNYKAWYKTGITSEKLLSDEVFTININLNTNPTSIKGMTIEFGENYPVDFDFIANTGQKIEFRGNTKSTFKTERVLNNVTSLKLVFYKMKNLHSRVRIYYIIMGYGIIYNNDSILSSKLENYVSPIMCDIPQIDFNVSISNYDQYFNVDNPDSAINFLETGQEMDILYGYKLPNEDKIEWIQGNHLYCSGWESDENKATIYCQDIFRNINGEYKKGTYDKDGKSFYNLIETLLKELNINDFYIEPRLKNLYTKNPIPPLKYKEALQILVNACRCNLNQSRYGKIEIKSNYIPTVTASTNTQTSYSKVENILKHKEKAEYGTFAKDYTRINSTMFFLPKDKNYLSNVGYVSNDISDENGEFKINPVLTFTMDAIRTYHGLKLEFGQNIPKEFIVKSYKYGELINKYVISDEIINNITIVEEDFDDCNKITIEFTKTAIPFNRITVNYFSLSDIANFKMTKTDILSPLKAIKKELIKEIIVPYQTFNYNDKDINLISVERDINENEIETFDIQEPSYGYCLKIDGNVNTELAEIIDSGSYFVKIKYKTSGVHEIEVQGHTYRIIKQEIIKSLNVRGKTIKWENPMIDNYKMATELANWLGEYYSTNIEYEYEYRGNPELDTTDIIYQENDFRDNLKVDVYRTVLNFNQSFRGEINARKVMDKNVDES